VPVSDFVLNYLPSHISAPNQGIFMKFNGYVGNEFPQGMEWSKTRFLRKSYLADGGHVPLIQHTGGQF